MGRLLVFITLAYVLGIILGRYSFSIQALFGLLAGALLWSLFNFVRKNEGAAAFIPLLLLFTVAGGLACHYSLQKAGGNIREFAGERCTLVGMVEDEPLWRAGEVVFPLRPEQVIVGGKEYPARGTVRVTLRLDGADNFGEDPATGADAAGSFSYGRMVSLSGVLYDAKERRNPGGFDYRAFLEARGIAAIFYGLAEDAADLGLAESLSPLRRGALLARERMSSVLTAFLPRREGGLLTGMLFGRRQNLDAATEHFFRRSGVSHLLAVSGLHTGLVAVFIFAFLKRTGLGRNRWLLFLFTAVFLFAYLLLTGVQPATLRAFIMILAGLAAFCLDREKDLPNALAAAALLTLLYNPLLLFNAGFQFSYAATTAIVIFASSWQEVIFRFVSAPYLSFFPYKKQFSALMAVTYAAQLGVLPLGAFFFGEVSLMSFVANMVLLPLMSLVLGIGLFAALLGMLLPVAGSFFALAAFPLLRYMIWLTELLGGAGFAVLELFPPRTWEIFLFYILLLSLAVTGKVFLQGFWGTLPFAFQRPLSVLQRWLMSRWPAVLLLLVLFFVWYAGTINLPGKLEVVFLDVGQGDAIYIKTPRGRHLLLDAGGRPPYAAERSDPGERVVLPFLQHRRVRKLDAVIVSHPHEDHFGGLLAVMDKVPVRLLLTNSQEDSSELYGLLLEMARQKNIPREMLQAGDRITIGPSLELMVLNPPVQLFSATGSDLNNNSLVIQVRYKEVSFLLTGDIETRAVEALLEENAPLQSTILKIPHHGGYLPELPRFLEKVNPAVAVITVGKNTFGHPHAGTLSALDGKNIETYRTDRHGAVIIRTDGSRWTVTTVVRQDSEDNYWISNLLPFIFSGSLLGRVMDKMPSRY